MRCQDYTKVRLVLKVGGSRIHQAGNPLSFRRQEKCIISSYQVTCGSGRLLFIKYFPSHSCCFDIIRVKKIDGRREKEKLWYTQLSRSDELRREIVWERDQTDHPSVVMTWKHGVHEPLLHSSFNVMPSYFISVLSIALSSFFFALTDSNLYHGIDRQIPIYCILSFIAKHEQCRCLIPNFGMTLDLVGSVPPWRKSSSKMDSHSACTDLNILFVELQSAGNKWHLKLFVQTVTLDPEPFFQNWTGLWCVQSKSCRTITKMATFLSNCILLA